MRPSAPVTVSQATPTTMAKWTIHSKDMERGIKCTMQEPSREVYTALSGGDDALIRTLSEGIVTLSEGRGYKAVFFETPVLEMGRVFEFVIMDATDTVLATAPADDTAFAAKCKDAGFVVAFKNLGGDAELVVPCRQRAEDSYAHLLTFLRSAPQAQVHDFWRTTGTTALQKQERATWVSTSGLGIAWLHLRFDSKPKYYTFVNYTRV